MSFLFNDEVKIAGPVSQFSEVNVVERTPVVEVIPINGVSELRNANTVSGSASISAANGEIFVSTGSTAGSVVVYETAEKGRYMAGLGGEGGIGIRWPLGEPTFAGTAFAEWGYANGDNGMVFGRDANGTYIRVYSNGVERTKVYSTSWNIDKLDGSGPSGLVWEPTEGDIYQPEFTWYGYGDIVFNIVDSGPGGQIQKKVPVHVYRPGDSASIAIPNLPIRLLIDNGDQPTDYFAYVGGMQFSVIGPFDPAYRIVAQGKFNKTTDDTLRPLITFTGKTDLPSQSTSKKVQGFDILAQTEDLFAMVIVGGNVSNTADFHVADYYSNNEVTTLVDTTANTITGGIPIWAGLIAAGATSQSPNDEDATGTGRRSGLSIDIPDTKNCTLCVKTVDPGSTGSVTGVFRWREEF